MSCLSTLDAPVRRVAAADTWVGYHPDLENCGVAANGRHRAGGRSAAGVVEARLVFFAGAFDAAAHAQIRLCATHRATAARSRAARPASPGANASVAIIRLRRPAGGFHEDTGMVLEPRRRDLQPGLPGVARAGTKSLPAFPP